LERYTVDQNPHALSKKKNPVVRRTPTGGFRLTTSERKRILLTHIYGVDLDDQAVEVTKLSLLLKVLEGETAESVANQLTLFRERALPDLGANIKSGNSLIAGDFYRNFEFDIDDLGEYEKSRINPFDWKAEFSDVMKNGGFHAIVGNPPYIPIETMEEYEREYYPAVHPQLERKFDTSVVFTLAMMRLLHPNGLLGFISSVAWQTGENFGKMRQHLLTRYGIKEVVNLPFDVFEAAYVDTHIRTVEKKDCRLSHLFIPEEDQAPGPRLHSVDACPHELGNSAGLQADTEPCRPENGHAGECEKCSQLSAR
jgi:hypothetical protein